jgi:hypothetical protein
MPKKFDDMVNAIKGTLKKDNPKISDKELESKAFAMATAQWKKMHGNAPSREKAKDWHVIEFYMPINESISTNGSFIIRGTAINETTTRNGITYVAEELEKSAYTFRNKPILLDHNNSVKNIVGRTTENVSYNDIKRAIMFEGKVMDKEIQQMIKDGRITNVSIGAKVQDLVDDKDSGTVKAVGIEGLEISFVAVPGDPNAGIASALWESYEMKKKIEEDYISDDAEAEDEEEEEKELDEEKNKVVNQIVEKEVINMTEDAIQKTEQEQPVEAEPKTEEKPVEEPVAPVAEEKVKAFDFESFQKSLTETITTSMKIVKEEVLKAVDEKMNAKVEVKTESVNPSVSVIVKKVDETKGIVASKTDVEEELSSDIVYEAADTGRGFQIWRNYTDTNKFKRLAR